MLFDLRGRGRRRTVQIIYLGLAVLIGVGLVGFGIGGGLGGGGLLNGLSSSGGGASASSQVNKDRKVTRRDPSNATAWATLTHDLYLQAGSGTNYDQTTNTFTSQGKTILGQVSQAWQRYLTLNPDHPSPTLASLMVQTYSQGALNQPANAVAALQILIGSEPNNASLYASLAEEAYLAKNTREGDLAAAKAVSLAPASERAQLRQELAQLKVNPNATPTAPTSGGVTTTNLPSSASSTTTSVTTTTLRTSSTK